MFCENFSEVMHELGAQEDRRSFQPQSTQAASFISGWIHAEEPFFSLIIIIIFQSFFGINSHTLALHTHSPSNFKVGLNTIGAFYFVVPV